MRGSQKQTMKRQKIQWMQRQTMVNIPLCMKLNF